MNGLRALLNTANRVLVSAGRGRVANIDLTANTVLGRTGSGDAKAVSSSELSTLLSLGTMAAETAANYLTKANNLAGLANTATARTNLGLGTAAVANTGITAGSVVALDGTGKLPAVDGSQLTNLPGGGGASYTTTTYSTGDLAALAYHDRTLNTAKTLSLLVGIRITRTAGTGAVTKVTIYDRDPNGSDASNAKSVVIIGSAMSSGEPYPVSGDADIVGPGQLNTGSKAYASIPMWAKDGANVYIRTTNSDGSNNQTATVDLVWQGVMT